MQEYPHDSIKPYSEGEGKKQQVSHMFDEIAPKYDFMNRFLSAGIDVIWRRKAIKRFKNRHVSNLLDVATGTGDMAIMAARMLQPESITGIDISEGMLELGKKKIENQALKTKIQLIKGDAETINFADNTFDGVMVAFGVRNFENLDKGLKEIFRVLNPGGLLVVLEFSKPVIPGIRNFYNFYMGTVAPFFCKLFSQNKKAYQYLNKSAKAFPDRELFVDILNKNGFSDTTCKQLSLGICCIYTGLKK
jgi:demethylmenaquinone methyltransferase/2-methoxy-6-polyprenyl-1,4-benzoquinol methylase